ncbi:hypothetical protein VNO77_33089 [Canavalia gladiata]|uniref:Uncharacterized protein n=1 Tax=Canavalia gladiata TaxID=3824 RepID=A0AAN9KE21_CANGL
MKGEGGVRCIASMKLVEEEDRLNGPEHAEKRMGSEVVVGEKTIINLGKFKDPSSSTVGSQVLDPNQDGCLFMLLLRDSEFVISHWTVAFNPKSHDDVAVSVHKLIDCTMLKLYFKLPVASSRFCSNIRSSKIAQFQVIPFAKVEVFLHLK